VSKKVQARPVRSMTGFARIAGEVAGSSSGSTNGSLSGAAASWTLSIKSVNHRYLDLQLRLPANTDSLEMQLRRILKENVARGHLDVTITYEPAAAAVEVVGYDKELVARYLAAYRDAQQEYELKQEPDLNAILRLPGVLRVPGAGGNNPGPSRREERQEAMDALETAVLERVGEALAALAVMRETEGAALVAVLIDSLARLEHDIHAASALRTRVQPAHYERLRKRMKDLLGGAVDRDRLLQEAAVLAERSDVEEELARLRMHVEHFRSLLREGGEVGKKLDFLLQEMNREANTLLSKSAGMADEGSSLTVLGLAMKSEIEKAREQVQNLE
jgi:uncharacterized protein (TIGR00255 family)